MSALPPMLRFVSPAELAERLEAERRGTPFLLYLDELRRQRIVELAADGGALSIGREPASDIRLDWDTEVSRAHAVVERVGSAWTLVDDGLSRNGSFVNGRRVHGRRRLDDGDSITVGRTLLVYVATEGKVRTTVTSKSGTPPVLSPAQQRVLDALCRPTLDGPLPVPASNRDIAAELVLSIETVKSHMHALFEVFDVPAMPQNHKRAELVRRAFERGAVSGRAS
jgi:pSer/pThr/pTyr-binding forkhead associated (FHA) protein